MMDTAPVAKITVEFKRSTLTRIEEAARSIGMPDVALYVAAAVLSAAAEDLMRLDRQRLKKENVRGGRRRTDTDLATKGAEQYKQ